MGTRHIITVKKDKEHKLAQYGQWDGYPDGQGVDILNILKDKSFSIEILREKVDRISFIKNEREFYDKVYKDLNIDVNNGFINVDDNNRINEIYPELNRDLGANIINLIQDEDKEEFRLINSIEFASDSLFCEWGYVIDLDEEVLKIFEGFNNKPLNEEEEFYYLQHISDERNKERDINARYYPIRLLHTVSLNDLPSNEEFVQHFQTIFDEREDEY